MRFYRLFPFAAAARRLHAYTYREKERESLCLYLQTQPNPIHDTKRPFLSLPSRTAAISSPYLFGKNQRRQVMMADPTVISLRPGGAGGLRAPRFLAPRFDSSSSEAQALQSHAGLAPAFKVPPNRSSKHIQICIFVCMYV